MVAGRLSGDRLAIVERSRTPSNAFSSVCKRYGRRPEIRLANGSNHRDWQVLARLFAQAQAQAHYNLVLGARGQPGLGSTAAGFGRQYGVSVATMTKDLLRREAPFEVYAQVKAPGIRIEALVNNVGQGLGRGRMGEGSGRCWAAIRAGPAQRRRE